jgi:hypothetical protein
MPEKMGIGFPLYRRPGASIRDSPLTPPRRPDSTCGSHKAVGRGELGAKGWPRRGHPWRRAYGGAEEDLGIKGWRGRAALGGQQEIGFAADTAEPTAGRRGGRGLRDLSREMPILARIAMRGAISAPACTPAAQENYCQERGSTIAPPTPDETAA